VKRRASFRQAQTACYAASEPVPKTQISDLLEALKALKSLQETIGKHDAALNRILDRLDSVDNRIAALEKTVKS